MKKNTIIILLTTFLLGCESPIEPEILVPYMMLNVGDVRQYTFDADSSHIVWEILDTISRSDNQNVFVTQISHVLSGVVYKATLYYYIKDNYLRRTNIDTTENKSLRILNPFEEQKLAMIYPTIGYRFLVNEGVDKSKRLYMNVNIRVEKLETSIKTFKDVIEYEQFNNDSTTGIRIFYSKQFGHLGSNVKQDMNIFNTFVNYIKIDGQEFGEFIQLPATKKVGKYNAAKFHTSFEKMIFNFL